MSRGQAAVNPVTVIPRILAGPQSTALQRAYHFAVAHGLSVAVRKDTDKSQHEAFPFVLFIEGIQTSDCTGSSEKI